jgi:hypothetical protein
MKLDFCVACGTHEELHSHHLKPRAAGGTDEETNLITLCNKCHAIYHNLNFRSHSHLTKLGLEKAKKRGVKLGVYGKVLAKANKDESLAFAKDLQPTLEMIQGEGTTSLHGISKKLNEMGVKTMRGKQFSPMQVSRILNTLKEAGQ